MKAETLKLTVQSDCADCAGQGVIDWPVCRKCGEPFTAAEVETMITTNAKTMRCGDSVSELVEEPKCMTCDGTGRVFEEICLSDLAAMLKELAS